MHKQFSDYRDGQTTFEAYIAHEPASTTKRPCVLVAHQWAGQSDHERSVAEGFAAQGYVGVAIDVYGKGRRGGLMDDNSELMNPLLAERAALRQRMLAALAAARAHPLVDPGRIAAVGYCFGGLCSTSPEAARRTSAPSSASTASSRHRTSARSRRFAPRC